MIVRLALLACCMLVPVTSWAISFNEVQTATDDAGSADHALQAQNLATGSLNVACFKWEGAFTLTSITDTASNTYTLLTNQSHSGGEPHVRCGYVLSATGNASNVVTGHFSGSAPYVRGVVYEFTYSGTAAFDVEVGSTENDALTTNSSNTLTTTGTEEVCIAAQADYTAQTYSNHLINGVATSMGNGVSGTGVQRVTIASDSTGTIAATQATAANLNVRADTSGATGAAPPARAEYVGGLASGATGGFVSGFAVCDSFANVNVTTATTTALITGVSGRHVRICGMSLVTAAANNVALISGTGATCGTGTTGMSGGTTAAAGWNFAANGGLTQGSGLGVINQTNATGDSVCIVTSATTQLSGRIAYAIY